MTDQELDETQKAQIKDIFNELQKPDSHGGAPPIDTLRSQVIKRGNDTDAIIRDGIRMVMYGDKNPIPYKELKGFPPDEISMAISIRLERRDRSPTSWLEKDVDYAMKKLATPIPSMTDKSYLDGLKLKATGLYPKENSEQNMRRVRSAVTDIVFTLSNNGTKRIVLDDIIHFAGAVSLKMDETKRQQDQAYGLGRGR